MRNSQKQTFITPCRFKKLDSALSRVVLIMVVRVLIFDCFISFQIIKQPLLCKHTLKYGSVTSVWMALPRPCYISISKTCMHCARPFSNFCHLLAVISKFSRKYGIRYKLHDLAFLHKRNIVCLYVCCICTVMVMHGEQIVLLHRKLGFRHHFYKFDKVSSASNLSKAL